MATLPEVSPADTKSAGVIHLYQHPGVAARNRIIATPTLVKEAPAPLRRLIGNLSDSDSVLRALDVAA